MHNEDTGLARLGSRSHRLLTAVLIAFPLGLFAGAAFSDVLRFADERQAWPLLALWLLASGVVLGLAGAALGILESLLQPSRVPPGRPAALRPLGGPSWSAPFLLLLGGVTGAQLADTVRITVGTWAAH